MQRRFCRILLAAVLLIGSHMPGFCGMIEVRPTTLLITPEKRTAVLNLQNQEDRPTIYQLRIYRWQQKDNEQILEPTEDVIASPPLISLDAHAHQIVRIGLRGALPATGEATYRLILEEVPGSVAPRRQGLNIALRLSFPLFVRAEEDAPPLALSGTLRLDKNHAYVTVRNTGIYAARLTDATLRLVGPDIKDLPKITRLNYILPGGWIEYDFPLNANIALPKDNVKLTLQADRGPIDLDLAVATQLSANVPSPVH